MTTLEATIVGDVGFIFGAGAGLAYDAIGDTFYLAGARNSSLYSVNPLTAETNRIGNHGLIDITGLAYVVPEPSSLSLLGLYLLGIAIHHRRT